MATNSEAKKDFTKFLSTARKRFDLAVEAERENRVKAVDDLNFRAGNQWHESDKAQREEDKRPCLTINKIPQYLRQVTNDQRQNRPAIKISPVDDNADIEVAKVYQGLIRNIEYSSDADEAYDTAFESAATHGFGYFRIITDFVDPLSFDQEIRIESIKNPFSVYLDPDHQKSCAKDMNWAFVFKDIQPDDYKAQYKDSELAGMNDWKSIGDDAPEWLTEDYVRVAEYFYKELTPTEIYLLEGPGGEPRVVEASKVDIDNLEDGFSVIKKRTTMIEKVKWCKINALEVLEEKEWPGRWIPIIPVYGDEININGKKIREGVVRHAKDPQRQYNYWVTAGTEMIALAPKAPWIGAAGTFDGFKAQWRDANVRNQPFLEYNVKNINGQLTGPPQRNAYEPPIAAITNYQATSSEDMKATTGIYDASLGNRSNENSGIAIQRRNVQAQTNNFHYVDNLSRALKQAGRIMVEIIPVIYDTARTVRTIGEDDQEKVVALNQIFEEKGEQKKIRLDHGKYDVTVSTGPSYTSKRQEASDMILEFMKVYPASAPLVGDILAKNMDWPGSEEIAKRLRTTLPPELREDEDGNQKPLPPEVQQQIEQMSQMLEGLTQELNSANQKLENKELEIQSKERIEQLKAETDMRIALLKEESASSRASFQAEINQLDQQQKLSLAKQGLAEKQNQQPLNPKPTGGPTPGQPME